MCLASVMGLVEKLSHCLLKMKLMKKYEMSQLSNKNRYQKIELSLQISISNGGLFYTLKFKIYCHKFNI